METLLKKYDKIMALLPYLRKNTILSKDMQGETGKEKTPVQAGF